MKQQTTTRKTLQRLRAFLVALSLVLAGLVGMAGSASADTGICSSYSGCVKSGHGDHGYGAHSSEMYWTMYPGHNCTNYAAYMAIRNGAPTPSKNLGSAVTWASQARASGILVDGKPTGGAIAQWNAGHVAYVESVNKDGSITVSEDNYLGDYHWRVITRRGDWPDNFIHFKGGSGSGSPSPSPWSGVRNATFLGNKLAKGQQMHRNQYIMSPAGRFVLMMQPDGNLVEYTSTGATWFTGTTGNPGAWLSVQSDGNVVLYSASGAALWKTGRQGISKLVVQDDENIVGYNSGGAAVWASGRTTSTLGLNYRSASLTTGSTLVKAQYLRSADGRYFALMQQDGNFVVYAPGYRVLWNSRTGGHPGAYIAVQSDGNVVEYASNGTTPLWLTGRVGITKLVIQSDGNLVGYKAAGTAAWSTRTTGML